MNNYKCALPFPFGLFRRDHYTSVLPVPVTPSSSDETWLSVPTCTEIKMLTVRIYNSDVLIPERLTVRIWSADVLIPKRVTVRIWSNDVLIPKS